MAGEWIKMRVSLPTDPKVIAMANHLSENRYFMNWLTDPVQQTCRESAYEHVTPSVTRSVTVTGLLRVWGMVMERCKRDMASDARVTHASLFTIDEVADVPGFGDAMESVGWVVVEDNCLIFPNFLEESISIEERRREQARIRKQRQRQREKGRDDVRDAERDKSVTVTHREEKRREVQSNPSAGAVPKGHAHQEAMDRLKECAEEIGLLDKDGKPPFGWFGKACQTYGYDICVDVVTRFWLGGRRVHEVLKDGQTYQQYFTAGFANETKRQAEAVQQDALLANWVPPSERPLE